MAQKKEKGLAARPAPKAARTPPKAAAAAGEALPREEGPAPGAQKPAAKTKAAGRAHPAPAPPAKGETVAQPIPEKPAAARGAPPKPAGAPPAPPAGGEQPGLPRAGGEGAPAESAPVPEKDKNYVSAVVYLGDERGSVQGFLRMLTEALSARFTHYELVFVEDASRDGAEDAVRAFLAGMADAPAVTMIHLSLKQGLELAMNAGLDMAVGDFVYEFDTMQAPYPAEMIHRAYDACLAGSDIVSVAPEKNRSLASRLFYRLFNAASHSKYPLHTDVFRLLSRRAINRVHGISPSMPYRKAAYAASGLRMQTLPYAGHAGGQTEHLRISRAVNSLALYTDIASRFSGTVAGGMLVLMVAALVYTLLVNFTGLVPEVAPGWTTMMLMLTGGFFGVFLLLAFVLKYLSLLVELTFRKQTYLVESVEKIK